MGTIYQIKDYRKIRNNHDVKTQLQTEDFGDRMQRIRTSWIKINRLMADLKQMSEKEKNNKQTEPKQAKEVKNED